MNTFDWHKEDRRFLYWLKYATDDDLFEFFERPDKSWNKWKTVAVYREIRNR